MYDILACLDNLERKKENIHKFMSQYFLGNGYLRKENGGLVWSLQQQDVARAGVSETPVYE